MFGGNAIDELVQASHSLMSAADLLAAALIKKLDPPKDFISMSQAGREYGRRWIQSHIDAGHLTSHRTGPSKNSKIVLSREEILALRTVETKVVSGIKEKYKRGPRRAESNQD